MTEYVIRSLRSTSDGIKKVLREKQKTVCRASGRFGGEYTKPVSSPTADTVLL